MSLLFSQIIPSIKTKSLPMLNHIELMLFLPHNSKFKIPTWEMLDRAKRALVDIKYSM